MNLETIISAGADKFASVGDRLNVGSTLSNLANIAYSHYQQRKQWQREDNAVQRRRADLEAAGLNPNLAAGSAASSSVVNGNDMNIDFGSKLDAKIAYQKLEQEKALTNYYKHQSTMSYFDELNQKMATNLNLLKNEYLMSGKKFDFLPLGAGGDVDPNGIFYELLGLDVANQRNNAHILQIDSNWAKANHIMNTIGQGVNIGTSIAGSVIGAKKAFNPFQVAQPKITSKTRVNNPYGYSDYYNY